MPPSIIARACVVAFALIACNDQTPPAGTTPVNAPSSEPARPAPSAEPGAAPGASAESEPEPAAETPPAVATQAAPAPRVWRFDGLQDGDLPEGWSAPVGRWGAAGASGAPGARVLVQSEKNRSPIFNLALVDDSRRADVDLSVRMRALHGRIDQGGGLVWRAADARNYYIARYNPLEDNYRIYEVVDGRRKQLGSADVEVDRAAWHTVRVRMTGDHIQCFLDGDLQLDVRTTTFPGAGMYGLWTKADAHTEFDDLTSVEAPEVAQ